MQQAQMQTRHWCAFKEDVITYIHVLGSINKVTSLTVLFFFCFAQVDNMLTFFLTASRLTRGISLTST